MRARLRRDWTHRHWARRRRRNQRSAAQFSCNALLGFGLLETSGEALVDNLLSAAIPSGQWRYDDGALYTLGLLHVSCSARVRTLAARRTLALGRDPY